MTTLLAPLLMLLLINLGNGQNDPSIRCPFRLSCARRHNNQQVLEFPAFPVPARFQVIDIDCKSQELFLSDTQNCLPRLFLRNNYSLFYPFRLASPLVSYNITFFNCSSVAQHHLKSWEQTNPGAQDMLSCPIYAAGFGESVVGLDLFRCTKILDQAQLSQIELVRNKSWQWMFRIWAAAQIKEENYIHYFSRCRWNRSLHFYPLLSLWLNFFFIGYI